MGKCAFIPYIHGWPVGVFDTIYEVSELLGISVDYAWQMTTPSKHKIEDARPNGGRLVMKVKVE